jgi:predicted dehydrogenase
LTKVGLIGNGKWGKVLYNKLIAISDVRFVCTSKDTYIDKLDEVDWVVVSTPNETHYEIVKDCLNNGKNVFCEKPLTLNHEQSDKLFRLAKRKDVKLFVDEVFWYRSELIQLHHVFSHNPKKLSCTWKKNDTTDDRNYIPASLYNLMYHDLYLLYIYIKDKKLESLDVFNKNEIYL